MNNKSKKIVIEISAGELLDKISILEIKLKKIKNKENQHNIAKEHKILKKTLNSSIKMNKKIKRIFNELKKINLNLWNIEDEIRLCERKRDFTENFVKLARRVYVNNDKRAKVKLDVNKSMNSNIIEIKKYSSY